MRGLQGIAQYYFRPGDYDSDVDDDGSEGM
jgi:hypothetical protein